MIFELIVFVLCTIFFSLIDKKINQQDKLKEKYNLLKEIYTYEKIKRITEDKGLKLIILKQTPKGHKIAVEESEKNE